MLQQQHRVFSSTARGRFGRESSRGRLKAIFSSIAGAAVGMFAGWKAHAMSAAADEGFTGAAAVVRLCPAAAYTPDKSSCRETPEGRVQIFKPPQVQAWQEFVGSRDGFISLQILAQPPADERTAAAAAAAVPAAAQLGDQLGTILLIERWKSQAALQAAETEAHNRVARLRMQQFDQQNLQEQLPTRQQTEKQQRGNSEQQQQLQMLADALTWPARAYTMDSRAATPLWLALR
ncbi:hypothetical protein, conserved [Eimeria tenella]|uniref:Uncharacterized protein n=1 Tax=Eimeria tenella TaxID=5802 RepID=U6KN50_EIMTE|nr:hypothetical protein, conserved [Eimeria tenella]CDJ37722.1 hypothetical protein, conserved [Eimeria tenella]|eukprot:XP_013228560.1 hypothetical protein, conserved [Eimeria tenella]